MITVSPLYEATDGAVLAYLLTIDGANILLDCGARDSPPSAPLDECDSDELAAEAAAARQYVDKLRELAPSLALVLLSHPLLSSVGLLPYLRARCGLDCAVYAALPTREMGRYAVQEWVEQRSAAEDNEHARARQATQDGKTLADGQGEPASKRRKVEHSTPTSTMNEGALVLRDNGNRSVWDEVWRLSIAEIADAFVGVHAVRWTQPVHLAGSLKGYTLTGYRSGHTLGGTLWSIRPSLSSALAPSSSASSFLYAPILNHVKEHHLDGAAILAGSRIDDRMRRLGLVVLGADRASATNTKRVDRDGKLLELVTSTLNMGRSVMLPTDASARLLELLILLESQWAYRSQELERFPICLISRTGKSVSSFLRSLTEWMGGQLGARGETTRTGGADRLLRFPHIRVFSSPEQMLKRVPEHVPKVVIVVPSSLGIGTYARRFFLDFARPLPAQAGSLARNLVLLTNKEARTSLAGWLGEQWNASQPDETKWGSGKVGSAVDLRRDVRLTVRRKVVLEGEELTSYLEEQRAAEEKDARRREMAERSRRMMQADDDDDSEDSEDEGADAAAFEDAQEDSMIPLSKRARVGGFAGGAGPWDEFLDPLSKESRSTATGGGQSFDIYVKGSFAQRSATDETTLARFRMFPVVERKRRVDVYGESIDIEGWMRRGMDDESEEAKAEKAAVAAAAAAAVQAARAEEDTEEEEDDTEPHKYIEEMWSGRIECQLMCLDMEGKCDGRALRTLIPQMNPRRLVLVRGDDESKKALEDSLRAMSSMTKDVYCPRANENVVVGEETKTFSIRLGDRVMTSMRLARVEDYHVAYISGVVSRDPESGFLVVEKASLTAHAAADGEAKALEAADGDRAQGEGPTAEDKALAESEEDRKVLPSLGPSLFVGELRLPVLKARLTSVGIPADFAGDGTLICGPAPMSVVTGPSWLRKESAFAPLKTGGQGQALASELTSARVAVKKVGRGRVALEGAVGETYYAVRKELYTLLAKAM